MLTVAAVEKIKPPASGQKDHFDKGYPGLALRVSYGGRKTWVWFYRYQGKQRRLTLGRHPDMSLTEAREAWRQGRKRLEEGLDPGAAKTPIRPTSDSFRSVFEKWMKRDQAQYRSTSITRQRLEKDVLPRWGDRPIASITKSDINDLLDGIVDRGSPIMARRVYAHLHRLFVWAVGRDIVPLNPMSGIDKPGAEKARDRTLTDEELLNVWNAAGEQGFPYGPAVQMLILTGCRREEIGKLKWSEVRGDTIMLDGDRTKNGEPHEVPLPAPARDILEALPRVNDYVFGPVSHSNWGRKKTLLDAASGVSGWVIHDLRRTVATGLQRLGVRLEVTEAVLNHKSGSRDGIVGVYQRHNYAGEKRSALEAWSARVRALVEGGGVGTVVPMRGRQ